MILDMLAASAKKRVEAAKSAISLEEMKKLAYALPKGNFCFENTLRSPGISFICEVKKASPSKGIIAEDFPYLSIACEYEDAGAACISVLTEPEYFKGSSHYLSEIKKVVKIPILQKDFTVDEYQIYEAKVIGADAVLLICGLLDEDTIHSYLEISDNLGISALVEAHTMKEIEKALKVGARVIGVNNRNLKTFEVNLENCISLRRFVPENILFVAESGIRNSDDIAILKETGVDAVLIGEALMRSIDKKAALSELKGE
ncbi:indole-3-glycerol phosphate synthase TrpC [Tissierella creatinini]|nr:indole-3-glycerol phosphate synthase TrpC [Tissierella creatinini]TJX61844.1 indole-3-glycerol phosphate synthase TrpC [Soehngenia saccharolytica]